MFLLFVYLIFACLYISGLGQRHELIVDVDVLKRLRERLQVTSVGVGEVIFCCGNELCLIAVYVSVFQLDILLCVVCVRVSHDDDWGPCQSVDTNQPIQYCHPSVTDPCRKFNGLPDDWLSQHDPRTSGPTCIRVYWNKCKRPYHAYRLRLLPHRMNNLPPSSALRLLW